MLVSGRLQKLSPVHKRIQPLGSWKYLEIRKNAFDKRNRVEQSRVDIYIYIHMYSRNVHRFSIWEERNSYFFGVNGVSREVGRSIASIVRWNSIHRFIVMHHLFVPLSLSLFSAVISSSRECVFSGFLSPRSCSRNLPIRCGVFTLKFHS